ncbi:flagellar hook-length control protein FliK [Thermanaerovibrio acidaminovorans]|jgi:hypothetical protein|uniref:flagellar hook-length control protein FliK n=1 Tax=Thermanaerovibrio acidaminovorans TaxID=81462 RepID=UPI002492C407|nr:flagellar hook-length control protein FliK [Thermanaerovibrio acidaminovorans]
MTGYDVGGVRSGGVGRDLGPSAPQPVSPGREVRGLKDGQEVEGLVLRSEDSMVQVRVGTSTLWARSSVPLFPGQRFRAIWDSSGDVPVLRLRQEDLQLLSRFPLRDRPLAQALILRGLPTDGDSILALRQAWMSLGGGEADLSAAVELFARGVPINRESVDLMGWYMALSPGQALALWRRIRDRLKSSNGRSLEEITRDDPEASRFLKAHRWAMRPVRWPLQGEGFLCPAFWPVGDQGPMARVVFSEGREGDRRAFSVFFDVEDLQVGRTDGTVTLIGPLLGVEIRCDRPEGVELMRRHSDKLMDDLSSGGVSVSHLSVSLRRRRAAEGPRPIDVEA